MAVSIAWILYSAMYLRNCEKYCGGNIWIWSTSINSYRLVSIIEIAHLKLCLDANICMYYALTFMSKNTQQILLRSTQLQSKVNVLVLYSMGHAMIWPWLQRKVPNQILTFFLLSLQYVYLLRIDRQGPSWFIAFIGGQINNLKSA